jgi:dipeptidyl aminopeptidase/acylaminoacyl peptidase
MIKTLYLRKYTVIIFLIVFSVTQARNNKIKYADLDSLPKISNLVKHNLSHPKWIDNNTVLYRTNDDSVYYEKFDVLSKTKVQISKTVYDSTELRKSRNFSKRSNVSPDEKWEASIKDNNIWVKNLETKIEKQLSLDGSDVDKYVDIRWSPNSQKIAAFKEIQNPIRKIPLIESSPKTQKQPILQWRNYNKPGDVLPIRRPVLFDINSGSKIDIVSTPFEHQFALKFGTWFKDSQAFTFEFNQRGHQVYQVVKVEATTGNTTILVDERSKTFIHYNKNYIHYSEDNKTLIWISERDNWRHLYLIDAQNGKVLKQLTKGEWVVRKVLQVNETENYILLLGSGKNEGEDPYNLHVYKLNLRNNKLLDLTPENATHLTTFSPDYKHFVDVYSRPDLAPTAVLRNINIPDETIVLESADIIQLEKTKWTMPEPFTAKGRDGKTDIWGVIYRPMNFDPSKTYPIVEYIYAGPHDSFVKKDFAAYFRFSKLAEMGYIIVSIDGMGTSNRSKSFHDVCWKNLKDSGFEDRILWIKAAAEKYNYMDTTRVGIYGYSAGGQSSLSALINYNYFYKLAVSLCGCHDNRMDKIWWNEQYMGYPIDESYSKSSNVDNAYKMKGKLFIKILTNCICLAIHII